MTGKQPVLQTSLPGPRARRTIARDARCTSPSYIKEYPLVIEKGEGCWVEDVDGNRFLDFMAGIAVNVTGYGHPDVLKAIREQSEKFLHICGTDFYYETFSALAESLTEMVSIPGGKRVFLTNSGAEAVEAALKLARYHAGRPYVISFLGAFHGRTMGALSLTASKATQRARFAPFLPGVHHVPYGYCFRCPYNLSYDSCGIHCARAIEKVLCRSLIAPEEIAAVFVEPIQGEGGYIVPPAEFLPVLREFTERHGILLVADEVQSGMGRTGRFLAIEHFGVKPDVVLLAKGLASGMPLGAVVASERVMTWKPGSHGSTFGGNPVSCAASLATLELLKGGLMENARLRGAQLLGLLKELEQQFPTIGDVRGVGLMIGVEIVKDGESRMPAPDLTNEIVQKAFRTGLLLLPCGESTIRFCPPLVVSAEEIETGVKIFKEILQSV